MGSYKSDDSLVSIVSSWVVIDGVASGWDSIGGKVTIGNSGVEVLGRVDLGHVGAKRGNLTVRGTEWSISITGNDEDGLRESRSVEGSGGSDRICH